MDASRERQHEEKRTARRPFQKDDENASVGIAHPRQKAVAVVEMKFIKGGRFDEAYPEDRGDKHDAAEDGERPFSLDRACERVFQKEKVHIP